jgi:hypothetical protein
VHFSFSRLLVSSNASTNQHDLRPWRISKGPRHLGTVAAYVLHSEEILHPLLGGPWDPVPCALLILEASKGRFT